MHIGVIPLCLINIVSHINIQNIIDNINGEYKGLYKVMVNVNPSVMPSEDFLLLTFECEIIDGGKPLGMTKSDTKMPSL